jgi:hypothetical protein
VSADRGRRTRPSSRADDGSVLLLFPAAVLIVLVLGSLAVDTAIVHLRQRQLVDAASAAASDAAAQAVDLAHYRRTGEIRLDPERAREVVWASLVGHDVVPLLEAPPQVRVEAGNEIAVELRGGARHVLSGVLPGAPRSTTVVVHGRATLDVDP